MQRFAQSTPGWVFCEENTAASPSLNIPSYLSLSETLTLLMPICFLLWMFFVSLLVFTLCFTLCFVMLLVCVLYYRRVCKLISVWQWKVQTVKCRTNQKEAERWWARALPHTRSTTRVSLINTWASGKCFRKDEEFQGKIALRCWYRKIPGGFLTKILI